MSENPLWFLVLPAALALGLSFVRMLAYRIMASEKRKAKLEERKANESK